MVTPLVAEDNPTLVTVPVFASVSLTHAVPLYFNTCPVDGVVIVTSLN